MRQEQTSNPRPITCCCSRRRRAPLYGPYEQPTDSSVTGDVAMPVSAAAARARSVAREPSLQSATTEKSRNCTGRVSRKPVTATTTEMLAAPACGVAMGSVGEKNETPVGGAVVGGLTDRTVGRWGKRAAP